MSYINYLHMTWCDAQSIADGRSNETIGLIPTGAVEQHGPHLPLATDMLIAEELAKRVAERFDGRIVVAPCIPAGLSDVHLQFTGTVSADESMLQSLINSYVDAFVKMGVNRIAIFSGHGGNKPLLERIVDNPRQDATVVAHTRLDRYIEAMFAGARRGGLNVPGSDQHGGGIETSQMLASHPHLVRSFADVHGYVGESDGLREKISVLGFREMTPTGVMGIPTEASAEAGEYIYEALTDELMSWIIGAF